MHSADRQMIINPAAYLITKRGGNVAKNVSPFTSVFSQAIWENSVV